MKYIGTIVITDQEHSILDRIVFEPDPFNHDVYLQNAEAVPRLLESLLNRDAIPPHRLAYFNDPEYQFGRLKGPRRSLFERNGTSGEEIPRHPHFLKYLWYFLFGARLPPDVIDEIKTLIAKLEPISGGDTGEICDSARTLLNRHRLDPDTFGEELFKLCLDCDVPLIWAGSIRRAVCKMR